MKSPAPNRRPVDPVAEIESMILHLTDMQHDERSAGIREDYRLAIGRLDALAYRIRKAAKPGRVVGLPEKPAPAPAPPPVAAAKVPQTNLPLGPVIVRARKPRR